MECREVRIRKRVIMEDLGVFWVYYLAFGVTYFLYRLASFHRKTTNVPLVDPTPAEIFYMIVLWPLHLLGFNGKDFS